jgi:hypothetical protein
MLNKMKIALVAALVAGSASAALARPSHQQIQPGYGMQIQPGYGPVYTDEGQGRFAPADGSGL